MAWDDEQEKQARENVAKNSGVTLTEDELSKYEDDADKYWDSFYDIHQNKFFKDRHWLFTEFPELAPGAANVQRVFPETPSDHQSDPSTGSCKVSQDPSPGQKRAIFEIGCGVGNIFAGIFQQLFTIEDFMSHLGNTILPILKYSTDQNLRVYGCDFSPKAIDILKQHEEFDSERCDVFVLGKITQKFLKTNYLN